MKRLWFIPLVIYVALGVVACSSAPADEPAPKGNRPEVIQADPNAVTPEQRAGAQRQGGGGEGDAD